MDKMSLKEAIERGGLDQFIAERDGETGDEGELERVIRSMAETSKEAPPASSPPDCDR